MSAISLGTEYAQLLNSQVSESFILHYFLSRILHICSQNKLSLVSKTRFKTEQDNLKKIIGGTLHIIQANIRKS